MNMFIVIKSLAVFATIAVVMLWENTAPKAANPYRLPDNLRRIVKNFMLFGVNTLLSPLIIIPVTVFAAGLFNWREHWLGEATHHWSLIIFDIVLLDFMIYWWHRFNHEVKFLWRFHQIHHLDRFLDVSTAVRFHFGEVVMSAFVRAAFIIVTDISLAAVLIAETLLLLSSAFQHSNLRLSERLERRLNWLIVTPAWHWLHHHHIRADTDSNYGNILTCWDRLFKSKSHNRRRLDMVMGLEDRPDERFLQLLWKPFKA